MSLRNLTTTNPTLLLPDNPKRTRLKIQMQPSSVDAGNTGQIFIAFGFQPVATVGHASQGEVLLQGAAIEEPTTPGKIDPKYKKAVWVTSSVANQSLTFDEETIE